MERQWSEYKGLKAEYVNDGDGVRGTHGTIGFPYAVRDEILKLNDDARNIRIIREELEDECNIGEDDIERERRLV